ncbi:integrase [bacterium]|nr:MAG: integrase [bacterium]
MDENTMLPAPARRDGLNHVGVALPALVADASRRAQEEFFNFFAAEIANENTREHYMRDVARFAQWCDGRGFRLEQVSTIHLAAYREEIKRELAPTSVKRHFSALRRLFGWWVEKGVLERNPVREVRTEKVSRTEGKTPAFELEDMQQLFQSFDTESLIGLRDRALIGVMAFTFARVTAAVSLSVKDYYPQGRRSYLRLDEKGGKQREIPCHHQLEEYLDAYLEAAGIEKERDTPLFRSALGRTGKLSDRGISRTDAYHMVQRRVREAGIAGRFSCHSYRATGITNFLENGGLIEKAQWIAGHSDSRTTKLYDRRNLKASLDDIERIRF